VPSASNGSSGLTATPAADIAAAGTRSARRPIILLAAILLVAASWGITDSYFSYLVRLSAINVAVVYSLNLLMGYAGQAFIATAATFAIGAYASALGMIRLGLPFFVAWPAGGILAGLFGLASSLPAIRLSGAYLAMVSIAFNVVVEEVLIHWTTLTGGPIGLSAIPRASIGGFEFGDRPMLGLIVFIAILTIYACVALRRSQWGLAFIAMRESDLAAKSLGIDTIRLKAVAFWVSSLITGLAGGLYAHSMQYVSPDIGTIFSSIIFVLMLVLGGIGTSWGPFFGAVILTLVPQLLSDFQRYHLLVLGVILLASVILMPKGIAQIFEMLVGRVRKPGGRSVESRSALVPASLSLIDLKEIIAPQSGSALVATEIYKSFGELVALCGIDIRVEAGTIQGLIGPNGSGKSTFVNVVTGFYRTDRGEVRFGRRRLDGKSIPRIARAGIVRTFQTPHLFSGLSVLENLKVAQFHHRAPSLIAGLLDLPSSARVTRGATDEAVRLARALGLEGLLAQRAGDLSQGDQRKLEIARALAARPAILILDEPAAGLSMEEAEALCTLLEQLRANGLGVLLVEHHMDVIMRVCDRITVLDRGRVIADGTPAKIREDSHVQQAYLGLKQERTAEARGDGNS
jgi:branched-chain amino acid transport system ATP-binding protein/branched-chain amino acid transport system permease protein